MFGINVTCEGCGKEHNANSTICPRCGVRRERCSRHGIEKRLAGCPLCILEGKDESADRDTFQLKG